LAELDFFLDLPDSQFYRDEQEKLLMSYRIHKEKDKPYLVFLHGYNGNSKSWAYQFSYFKNKFSLIAFDFPGFGGSEKMNDPDMFKVSNLIYRTLKKINVQKFSLVGHSMGGMLAQILAANYPESIYKLILSCTHTGYALNYKSPLREPYMKRLEQRKEMSDLDYGKLRIKKMLPNMGDTNIFNFLAKISEEITEESILCGGTAMQILNTKSILYKIKCPCLILTGSDDIVVSKEKSSFLIDQITHSMHHEIDGVGHAPYCENYTEFNDVINSFLTS
tara:strand:- start:524 stop:1354 length:831 start_codon:yes stop_codon:yes gene_type:complete